MERNREIHAGKEPALLEMPTLAYLLLKGC